MKISKYTFMFDENGQEYYIYENGLRELIYLGCVSW